jgi:hypothetical protein
MPQVRDGVSQHSGNSEPFLLRARGAA